MLNITKKQARLLCDVLRRIDAKDLALGMAEADQAEFNRALIALRVSLWKTYDAEWERVAMRDESEKICHFAG